MTDTEIVDWLQEAMLRDNVVLSADTVLFGRQYIGDPVNRGQLNLREAVRLAAQRKEPRT